MNKAYLLFVWTIALVLSIFCTNARAGAEGHLGATAFISAGSCMFLAAATNWSEPWAAAIAGFAAGNLAGLAVEHEQNFQGDFRTDLLLNLVGSSAGALACQGISESIRESRKSKETIHFHGGGPAGSAGGFLRLEF